MPPTLKLGLDQQTYDALLKAALREYRSVAAQAAVELRKAMGLPFPSLEPLPDGAPAAEGVPHDEQPS